ncbi:helix-turn-helix domain-containing protein [Sulfurimonas sp. SAG-AH-194-L11]|nr:helix-turn-helix domain-containing protein [Sulfurimonas sp. SAG-AH-194-L11]MDF1877412.1 helix-turn-helix domain-containing protein [Sulfurimonas sp. SAG-AH-194-L11]
MNINLKDLQLLPEIYNLLCKLNDNQVKTQKRWLSVKELSAYLTFGKDKIYKMVDIQFIESEHYYKKENRLLFDRDKIDEWVVYSSTDKLSTEDTKYIIDDVLSTLSIT